MDVPVIVAIILLAIIAFNRLWIFRCKSKVFMGGKTALLIGGVSGIGYQVALDLASRGCRVIIADVVGTTETVERLRKSTHNPHIEGRHVDLSNFKSVRRFVEEFKKTEPKLDLLINNSGVSRTVIDYTEDGLDATMQINYFSHFLIIHLLLDLLQKSAPSRVLASSSIMAHLTKLDLAQLNPQKSEHTFKSYLVESSLYGTSKICLAAAARVFAKKLKNTGVTVNIQHPGAVATGIYFNGRGPLDFVKYIAGAIIWILGKSAEEGAQTILHLAYSDEVKDISGQFFAEGRVFFHPLQLYDWKVCEEIWKKSIEYTGLQPHEILC